MRLLALFFVLSAAAAVALHFPPGESQASAPLVGCPDFNGDGVVTQADVDLQTLGLGARLGEYEYLLLYDADTDGVVTQSDVDATVAALGSACPLIDTQVTQATLAVLDYRDLNAALADGFVQGTQNIAGHGIHYINTQRMSDNVFDITRPEGLNYTPDGRLIAIYYIVPIWFPGNDEMPDGFDGPEDHWHYHDGLCQWQTTSGPAVAENVSQADCLSRPGGIWWEQFGWMLHLWNFQHNPMGRFMMHNPDISTTPDVDGDGLPDGSDNCPSIPNPDQTNTDAQRRANGAVPGDFASNPGGDAVGDACDDDDDNDWLLDEDEGSAGTGPLNPDSDGDRVVDGAEVLLGSDPLDGGSKPPGVPPGDGDGDGLPAPVEDLFGSSDASMDSDGDGFIDGLEVKGYGTSPASVDSDGDVCEDWVEIVDVNGNRTAEFADVFAVTLRAVAGSPGDAQGDAVLDVNKNGVVVNDLADVFTAVLNSNSLREHARCGADTPA